MTTPEIPNCPRVAATACPFCGEPAEAPCPLAAPAPFDGPAIGAVAGTCDPGEGVCEACQ